jgi:subtilisin family serine protease
MAGSSLPPEDQARVKPFDPLVLDRTVIAIPLLREMEADLARISELEEADPTALGKYNAGIEYEPAFRGGLKAARKRVIEMADDAAKRALRSLEAAVERSPEEGRPAAERRLTLLRKAVEDQTIEPLLESTHYGLARLHASVIRRLLAENARLADEARENRRRGMRSGEDGGETLQRLTPLRNVYPARFEIIIDVNLEYPGGREAARRWVLDNIERAKLEAGVRDAGQEVHLEKEQPGSQYVFARLEARAIQKLVELDLADAKATADERRHKLDSKASGGGAAPSPRVDPARFRAVFHIWPDFEISASINRSISTVKADAAQNSFSAAGAGITWAVMDSGIDATHTHFKAFSNIDRESSLHRDFTVDGHDPFNDENGHGTHVAGIIAGQWRVTPDTPEAKRPLAISRYLKKDTGDVEYQETRLEGITGMAPRCKLVSLRVLDENGKGVVSNLIAAIGHIQEVNGYGRRLLIHGVNMSVGYSFEPEWFACGQSPLCVEVDRLVKSGVVVVVSAGNTGYGTLKAEVGATSAGMALTINDPGNADLAITVGSTHRDMPHVYGISYFSSKGPTGDGRLKPDLVAPGEKIISCATGLLKASGAKNRECDYVETSGTSMAAPHVSGVIAAFLSVRGEFIGKAERVKEIFLSTATDLRRDRYFQGAGLVDLMRAIQSV